MEWRCRACGRLAESSAQPCECGSREFERAVVQLTKRCTTCGALAPESADACEECGFTGFDPLARRAVDGGYMEWRCDSCGHDHPKHAPPCSRCGHDVLNRVHVDAGAFELSDHLDGGPWWTLGFSKVQAFGIALLVGVVLLFLTGIAGLGPAAALVGSPSPDPGAVESGVPAELNDTRREAGLAPLDRNATLGSVAAALTASMATGESTSDPDAVFADAGYDCEAPIAAGYEVSGGFGDGLATALADRLAEDHPRLTGGAGALGIDARTADDHLYVAIAAC